MISSARTLGAPVTEPGGNVARITSAADTPARVRASIVETRWCTPGCDSSAHSSSTETVPKRATRPRSLRARSTIITFSAMSFALERRASAWRRSAAASAARGRVPLIGRVSIASPRRRRKRSGEAEITSAPPRRTSAAYGAGLSRRKLRVERERIAAPLCAEALGEVHLEDVAGSDVVDRALHRGLVVGAWQRGAPVRDRRVRGRRVAGVAQGPHAGGPRRRPADRSRPPLVVELDPGVEAPERERRQAGVVAPEVRQALDLAAEVV